MLPHPAAHCLYSLINQRDQSERNGEVQHYRAEDRECIMVTCCKQQAPGVDQVATE
jgi:hypothetical protein